jgi:hypothetical protein
VHVLTLSENPPATLPGSGGVADCRGRWWVAHTKARCEKAFARDLLARRVAYFLPMCPRVRVSGGRKRTAMIPLFPSYVFFCGNEADRSAALTTNRLCRTIDVPDQDGLLRELAGIEKALSGRAELDLYPHAVAGRRFRVCAGPFEGVEGVVLARSGRARIVLEVRVLSCGAAMEIDADLLEPAE